MNVSLPASLANLTIAHLNFTQNCSNVALGLTVWLNDFNYYNATPGNLTATNDLPGGVDNPTDTEDTSLDNDADESDQSIDPVDNGPTDAFTNFWTNGTSPEWIGFWRAAVGSALPTTYMNLTDTQIIQWSNTTDAFDFFDPYYANSWASPTDRSEMSYYLANQGGCSSNGTLSKVQGVIDIQPACMVQYCCLGRNDEESQKPYPFYPEFTVLDACSFDSCQRANQGNPDLGGIGARRPQLDPVPSGN